MSTMKKEDLKTVPTTTTPASSNQSGSNDFVKKLFQMLQEDSYKDVVRWTVNGDSFVVLNTNEFTKELLPRHFKHSNFASFVRQLNKYDFHKVKIPNEEKQNYLYGDDAWEFKHPDFRMNDVDALDNIKRKGPGTKKNTGPDTSNSNSDNLRHPCQNSSILSTQIHLKDQIEQLNSENFNLHKEINLLNTKYKALIDNVVAINSINERNYQALGNLLSILVQSGIKVPPLDFPNPALVSMQGRPSNNAPINNNPISQPHPVPSQQQQQQQSQLPTLPTSTSNTIASTISPPIISPVKSIMGELPILPQQPIPTMSNSNLAEIRSPPNNSPETSPKFHVLLVEDDRICIQLCRKFLVKYGCEVTVVTDGLNAISNVETTKYDLILMDIVMPNLDGATATSVIRSFDTKTPIIAMTGNIDDNDLVTYLQNGMSDILAKPFTKDDLYSILAKHLLKKDPQQASIPQVQRTQPPQPNSNSDLAPQEINNNNSNNSNNNNGNSNNSVVGGGFLDEEPAMKKARIV